MDNPVHRFLVSTGIADVTFFLPMKRVPSSLHDAQIGEFLNKLSGCLIGQGELYQCVQFVMVH